MGHSQGSELVPGAFSPASRALAPNVLPTLPGSLWPIYREVSKRDLNILCGFLF